MDKKLVQKQDHEDEESDGYKRQQYNKMLWRKRQMNMKKRQYINTRGW